MQNLAPLTNAATAPLPRSRFRFLRSVANRIEKRARDAEAFELCGKPASAAARYRFNDLDAETARQWCVKNYREAQS